MCTRLDTRNGVHYSLADDETARKEFALEHGCGSLAEIASGEHKQLARHGLPDSEFLSYWREERRREILERRQERKLRR
jgi:hypothetical protein